MQALTELAARWDRWMSEFNFNWRNEMAKLKGLNINNACNDGANYFNSFATPQGFVANCNRGDWLLWLFSRTNPEDKRKLTLAKALCAATVIDKMKDRRSIDAVHTAIMFGIGFRNDEQLKNAADAAYAERIANRQLTADICRKILPVEIWNF